MDIKDILMNAAHYAYDNLPSEIDKKRYERLENRSISYVLNFCIDKDINMSDTKILTDCGDVMLEYTEKVPNDKDRDVNSKIFCRILHTHYWKELIMRGLATSDNNFGWMDNHLKIFRAYCFRDYDRMMSYLNIASLKNK